MQVRYKHSAYKNKGLKTSYIRDVRGFFVGWYVLKKS